MCKIQYAFCTCNRIIQKETPSSVHINAYKNMGKSSYNRHNQALVIWNHHSRTNNRQVSWLTDCRFLRLLSMMPMTYCRLLPVYSDRLAQDFHLILFYPCDIQGTDKVAINFYLLFKAISFILSYCFSIYSYPLLL